ncbi:helix-turn-helix transcriptional regulator [Chryseobacterium sp. MP_3.2]|uniref:helix-turn-helix transcriptional regulator n=1 Tax=Chryseobacterium sp. MP_3.2 TaxID=3071712 RepID=UPI002DF74FE9|nr:hypothetical protein [Chryseobacterium sp. MP_3.2]
MNATRLYPGMCDDSLEIFFHPEEQKLKAIDNGSVKDFSVVSAAKKQFLNHMIETDSKLAEVLESMIPNDHLAQIEKIAKCRFGGLNFQPDYCGTTKTINHDIINCAIRKTCIGCGIVCKNLSYQGEEISNIDVLAIQLMASDHKTEVLAEELNMPLGTFHVYRTKFFNRLGVKSKPELARVGVELGLI